MAPGARDPRLRLLLDEMWSPTIAEELRRRGHDVAATLESDELRGLSDEALLEFARSARRVIVTQDVGDSSELLLRWSSEDRDHHGVILVSPRRFSSSTSGVGALVRALDAVLRAHPGDDDLVNDRMWLESE